METATGQNGFNIRYGSEYSQAMDFDDLIINNNNIYIRGNIYVDSLNQWGLYVCKIDSSGNVLWHNTILDVIGEDDLVSITSTKIIITSDGNLLLPVNYFFSGDMGLVKIDTNGNVLFNTEYTNSEYTIYPTHLVEIENNFYISGYHQRSNFRTDVFLLKTDLLGNKLWLKHYGDENLDEGSAGMICNKDLSISLGCQIRPPNFIDLPFEEQWRKPWLITIDTSGRIIEEWKGEPNDFRAKSSAGLIQTNRREWGMIYSEFEEIGPLTIYSKPAISVIDSNYNLKWKDSIGEFNSPYNTFFDIDYDSLSGNFVVCGQLGIDNILKGCIIKYSSTGERLWTLYETNLEASENARFWLGGVSFSPSGSIYSAGYIESYSQPNKNYGWILKITADGCVDTLCTTTGMEEIIRSNQQKLYLYPNPVEDELNIRLDESLPPEITISIVNAMGQRMYTGILEDHKMSIPVSDWLAGLYFVQAMHHGKHIASVKVIHL